MAVGIEEEMSEDKSETRKIMDMDTSTYNYETGQYAPLPSSEGTVKSEHLDLEQKYRKLLWSSHAGGTHSNALYGDDGEMQCNHVHCLIDFKRQPLEQIESRLFELNCRLASVPLKSETVPTEAAKPTFEQEFMDNMRNTAKRVRENPEIYGNFRVAESEAVEERAQFEKWAVVRIPDGPVFHWIESEHRYAHELYQIAFEAYLLDSSLP